MFEYEAKVVDVYDGDTITVDIDLGLGIWLRGEKLRIYGISAPEVRGVERPKGLASRNYLRTLILGKAVKVRTLKDAKGKYGRYLATVLLPSTEPNIAPMDIAAALVLAGQARFQRY